jgi:hypothetical protein
VKSGRASVASKAWKKVVNLPDLQQAQYKRVVVPVESAGNSFKILVQELNGELAPGQTSISMVFHCQPCHQQQCLACES